MKEQVENEMKLEFLNKGANEAFARITVAAFASQLDPTIEEIADIKTAVSEAVTNAIIHGYEEKIGIVKLVCKIKKNEVLVEISDTGYFKFMMNSEKLSEGKHSYSVRANLEGGVTVNSITQTVTYSPVGPWITIDNFDYGEFAVDRPYIRGRAGYNISQEEIDALHKSIKEGKLWIRY